MPRLTEPETEVVLTGAAEVSTYLAERGLWYRRVDVETPPLDAPDELVLSAYAEVITELQRDQGYAAVDVATLHDGVPQLDQVLAKFAREHRHAEDEVRITVAGRGVFHVHPDGAAVFRLEVEANDAFSVPAGTRHWFHLCEDRFIRAIRLFVSADGWVPEYTESGLDNSFEPLCLGGPLGN